VDSVSRKYINFKSARKFCTEFQVLKQQGIWPFLKFTSSVVQLLIRDNIIQCHSSMTQNNLYQIWYLSHRSRVFFTLLGNQQPAKNMGNGENHNHEGLIHVWIYLRKTCRSLELSLWLTICIYSHNLHIQEQSSSISCYDQLRCEVWQCLLRSPSE